MKNCIITQAKDQSYRLKDWVLYHYEEGFDTFIYFDDYSEDDSVQVLKKLSEKYKINIIINYSDKIGNTINSKQMKNSNSYAGNSSVNYRLIRSYNTGLKIARSINTDAICSITDVDEFLVSNVGKVTDVIKDLISDRKQLYIHSFDVDDRYNLSDWYTTNTITARRWDYESRKQTIFRNRGKSICVASYVENIPQDSNYVHVLKEEYNGISDKYSQKEFDKINILDIDTLRIHHFRQPMHGVNIQMVVDTTLVDKMLLVRDKYEKL